MIFTKKTVSIILALALALSLCPMAFAAGSVNTYSSNIVSFIKSFEGFEPNVYEDKLVPGTYSIGYGFVCGKDDFPDGITEAEAEKQMTDYLDTKVVPVLNSFVSENGITLSQNQYDALVSFTYNLGTGWMNDGYRIYRYLKAGVSNYTDAQIADAIGVCGHAGGVAVEGLIARMRAEIGRPAKVVATGGLAILFDQHTDIFDAVDADLTLDGLALLAERAAAA